MKKFTILAALLLAMLPCSAREKSKPFVFDPSAEYMFARRDSSELFMSVYEPRIQPDSLPRPTILFSFGGGFVNGSRNSQGYLPWFKRLTEDGYRVISIDYRLGLKGKKVSGTKSIDIIYEAIRIGVEDLYTATAYILENAEALGVAPGSIVLAGSSAGAIISMQAEWHASNGDSIAGMLPSGFRYAGVLSFAGAVFSRNGKPSYKREPAPTLFIHGTRDKVVAYGKIHLGKNWFCGAEMLSGIFAKGNYNYNIYRYEGNQHEMASEFLRTYDEQLRFLRSNVEKHEKRIVDATVSDPSIKVFDYTLKDLYSN